ncbi:MAG TPA: hypothetical protein VK484_06800, partial [Ferruginibacter sp.]|nr:hypothetical protein [Ferruginibacter sp.]
ICGKGKKMRLGEVYRKTATTYLYRQLLPANSFICTFALLISNIPYKDQEVSEYPISHTKTRKFQNIQYPCKDRLILCRQQFKL